MSIKIYYGCKIQTGNMVELMDFCKKVSSTFQEIKNSLFYKIYASCDNPVKKYLEIAKEDFKSKNEGEKSMFDTLSAKLVFFPLNDKETLLMPCFNYEPYNNLWATFSEIKFYGYWDNTDPDENCSDEEWEQRKADWHQVFLNNSDIPEQGGFTFILTDDKPTFPKIPE